VRGAGVLTPPEERREALLEGRAFAPDPLLLPRPPVPLRAQLIDLPFQVPDLALSCENTGLPGPLLPPDQDPVGGHHVAVEGHVGVPHAVAVPEPDGGVEGADQERSPEQSPDQIQALRRRRNDLGERCDDALLADVSQFLVPCPQGHRDKRSPTLPGLLEVVDGRESLGVVPDHHRLHPLSKNRLDRLLVHGVGFDHLAHHAEDPAILLVDGLGVPEVLENGAHPRGSPVPPLAKSGKSRQPRFGRPKLALGQPGRLDRRVEPRVRLRQRRSRILPGALRGLECLPRRRLGGGRRIELERSLPHRGGRLFDPLREAGEGSLPLRDPLRERFGAGPRVGVLRDPHDQVGLGALGLLPGETVLFARCGQRGVLLLPTRAGM
jgi:hypothetical protein